MTRIDYQNERFRRMAIRVATHLAEAIGHEQMKPILVYDEIPERLRRDFETLSYCELIRPLVHRDRYERKATIRRIAISYGITVGQVRVILTKKRAIK